jgi:hypothetical protein
MFLKKSSVGTRLLEQIKLKKEWREGYTSQLTESVKYQSKEENQI